MHILVAYKQFPAPQIGHAGGQSVWRLLVRLRERGHRLSLVARIDEEERRRYGKALAALEGLCEGRLILVPHHRAIAAPRPLALLRSYVALRRAVIRALDRFRPDLLHVEFAQTGVATLGLPVLSFRAHDVNWFLAAQRAASLRGAARGRAEILRWAFRRAEPWLYRRYAVLAAISEGDRRLLVAATGRGDLLTLPLEPSFPPEARHGPPAVAKGRNLLFVGAMDRAFNIEAVRWFLEHVWPDVRRAEPEASFYVVGAHPPAAVREWDGREGVHVTGFVDDLAAWYRAADLFVSPMLVAGGLLQKVLDAMAMGVPVVATPQSNHGVGAPPEAITLADDARAFAEAIVALLRDRARARRQAERGVAFVTAHYDLDRALARWEEAVAMRLRRDGDSFDASQ